MTRGEFLKALLRRMAFALINAQELFNKRGRVLRSHVSSQQASDRSLVGIAPANMQMIALDLIPFIVHCDFCADEAYIADIMLRARMVTASEMNIDRRIQQEMRIHVIGDFQRMSFGVGRRKFTSSISSAGDKTCAYVRDLAF